MKPQRIQRKRTKGWRAPEGAVYVGRPTRWGNPFVVGAVARVETAMGTRGHASMNIDAAAAVALYEVAIKSPSGTGLHIWAQLHMHELRGRDLICWCPYDQPCHADALLRLANA